MTRVARIGVTLVALLAAVPATGAAQYFGQNKVQYEDFKFQVLKTPNFDIYYYPEERRAIEQIARLAEVWYSRLSAAMGLPLTSRQPLIMYSSQPHFAQTQVVEGLIGESTGGVTELLKRRMVLPFAASLGETSHVLGHEMVHAFQFDQGGQNALALPLWFIEGMAEYLSIGPDHPHTAMWLRSLAQKDELPGFEDLNNPEYFPYRFGHAAWAFLAAEFGENVVPAAFLAATRARDPLTGIEQVTGTPIEELSERFRAAIRERYGAPAGQTPPGQEVVSGDTPRQGRLHVSPAISPDGKWLVYLSERDPFSIDYVLAEADTGRVVRRLTSSATDPHLESLQFVNSAGAWDATSQRFAFITIRGGQASLRIVNVSGDDIRDIALDAVDDAWQPTWSPNGQRIAFSGHRGGVSDLYVLDLESAQVQQITDDAYADLQPDWAPTGERLAFVTDRFTSNLDRLEFGEMRLATVDVSAAGDPASARIEALPALPGVRHINPQWTEDGRALLLVADEAGVPNVYRLTLDDGRFERVTSVPTGVSGLTPLSPAMSLAPGADRYAYGVFTQGGYDIRVAPLTPASVPAATPVRPTVLFARGSSATAAADTRPRVPASAPVIEEPEPYSPSLSLDFVGASGGIGTSNAGAFAAGGIGLQFSDVLGDHTLGTVIQANGGVRDIGGQAMYLNRTSRWNWGGMLGLVPYASGGYQQTLDTIDGVPVVIEESLVFRQTELQARAITMYPFSRALRFEVQAGGRRIWFDRELTTSIYGLNSGQLLSREREDFEAPDSLNLADASAALVYDQTGFGPVGPVTGQRFRFDVTPTFGSLQYTNVLLDYRRYLVPLRPFTLALRGLHVGRYGNDGEDSRLSPLFLGYSSLVRGYDLDSFDPRDCGNLNDCQQFDRLVGSRMAVGNAELRFPLLGVFGGDYRYGPIPVEGFLFADTGVAWTSTEQPTWSGGDRSWVSSVGAGARVNVFGYVVIQLAAARPLDRATGRWRFVFDFSPAF
jgi:hypothetical protein